ncbi:MAG: hypothetical protein AAFN74_06350 [Myxococcota bacterium]
MLRCTGDQSLGELGALRSAANGAPRADVATEKAWKNKDFRRQHGGVLR